MDKFEHLNGKLVGEVMMLYQIREQRRMAVAGPSTVMVGAGPARSDYGKSPLVRMEVGRNEVVLANDVAERESHDRCALLLSDLMERIGDPTPMANPELRVANRGK